MARIDPPGTSDELRREFWRLWGSGSRSVRFPGLLATLQGQSTRSSKRPGVTCHRRESVALTSHEREEISRGLRAMIRCGNSPAFWAGRHRQSVERWPRTKDAVALVRSHTRNVRRSAYCPETRCSAGMLLRVCGETGHRSRSQER
jgi:hypothetical protein